MDDDVTCSTRLTTRLNTQLVPHLIYLIMGDRSKLTDTNTMYIPAKKLTVQVSPSPKNAAQEVHLLPYDALPTPISGLSTFLSNSLPHATYNFKVKDPIEEACFDTKRPNETQKELMERTRPDNSVWEGRTRPHIYTYTGPKLPPSRGPSLSPHVDAMWGISRNDPTKHRQIYIYISTATPPSFPTWWRKSREILNTKSI